ncbi:protocadherin alpha-5 isoform X3 [Xenopus tropicalis]|uniref:Protocadherin alpha-5 isoform X3 n=1 Tax=Xenopus tropicalis TaxID=8364 RepID=A0A8J1J9R3_XENTR|nr:protocadherin alpha-5 isoform X3 [Xenopus tropicalis]
MLVEIHETSITFYVQEMPTFRRNIQAVYFSLLLMPWDQVLCQLHYSIPEESKHGTFVGRIAQDLGLDISEINSRLLRIISRNQKEYFQVNLQNGILFVKHAIDREELCPDLPLCIVSIQVVVDKPVQIHRVDVEIEDINDNYPAFPSRQYTISILESRLPGTRFPLEGAVDADIGTNSITNYELSDNDYFILELPKFIHQIKSIQLVLKKPLDREKISLHNLTLTAFDGGKPKLSGSTQLIINVEDANDNPPVFNQLLYQSSVVENSPKGTLVARLNASDLDQGKNGEISYEFSKLVPEEVLLIFSLDKYTGELWVKGELDYEKTNTYEIHVDAFDNGESPLTGHCQLVVTVVDLNDNAPEVSVTSLFLPVPEDATQGTIVAMVSVHDQDSGVNGRVNCYISPPTPFKINPAFTGDFSLLVNGPLDRENTSEYQVVITAKDEGSPALSSSMTINVEVSDVNDNAPLFQQSVHTIFIKENNPPGSHIYTVSASDSDTAQNSFITYSLSESFIEGIPISSYISINPENGKLFSLLSFDHEQVSYFQCHIKATDAGLPPLSSNLTLNIFIMDVNDNVPVFTSANSNSASAISVTAPKSAQPGHLVTKVNAVDLDSGYNAWMSYTFKNAAGNSLFAISKNTGEIRVTRPITEAEGDEFRLFVVAEDHGEPAMTALTQIIISIKDSGESFTQIVHHTPRGMNEDFSDANIYLVVAICSISSIFLITLITFTVLRWQKYRDEVNQLRDNYKICSNTVGSWVYSQSQYKFYSNSLQGKNDLIVFTPNIPQSSQTEETMSQQGIIVKSSSQPKHPHPDWRYSASLRAAMQGAVHMEGAAVLRGGAGGLEQQWPTVSSATPEPEGGEVSPPVGAGVNCNSWTFKYGPGNPKQPVPQIPPDFPENFIIPGSPAIISIRQDQPSAQNQKNFITFGKKEETKKKKKKKKGNKNQDKGNNSADNNDK